MLKLYFIECYVNSYSKYITGIADAFQLLSHITSLQHVCSQTLMYVCTFQITVTKIVEYQSHSIRRRRGISCGCFHVSAELRLLQIWCRVTMFNIYQLIDAKRWIDFYSGFALVRVGLLEFVAEPI